MALLVRLGLRQGCRSLQRFTPITQQICSIKTTTKKGDMTYPVLDKDYEKHKTEDRLDKDENWMSFGYNHWNREEDTFEKHLTLFSTITIGMIGSFFILYYMPDMKLRDWSQREAFLQLADREAKGLPLIDPNFIPPEKMEQQLPTDEELGDVEVII